MRPPKEVKSEALLAAEPPFLYPSCFHAQQASEKYLKALLTWHQKDTAALTPYGVDIRHPGDQPEPNLEETRQAVELARKVRCAAIGRLQEDP